jgi:hypothetical protein
MEKITLEFNGKQDEQKLTQFFKKLNITVKNAKLPTNLYTHTNSPIDIAIIDFDHFDINNFIVNDDGLSIATIYNKFGKISNHLILNPNTLISAEFNIKQTAGEDPYDYLGISLRVSTL